jgi:hypothetical protein
MDVFFEDTSTKLVFQIEYLKPLTTNQSFPLISSADAVSILNLPGVQVVVIGPDSNRSNEYVGKQGEIGEGGTVCIATKRLVFPETSLCRSERRVMPFSRV